MVWSIYGSGVYIAFSICCDHGLVGNICQEIQCDYYHDYEGVV